MIGTIRPPREGDIPAVVRLTNDHSPEPVAEHSVSLHWTAPGVELRTTPASRTTRLPWSRTSTKQGGGSTFRTSVGNSPDWAVARAAEKGHRLLSGSWVSNEPLPGSRAP
jgi:hypothetical protein